MSVCWARGNILKLLFHLSYQNRNQFWKTVFSWHSFSVGVLSSAVVDGRPRCVVCDINITDIHLCKECFVTFQNATKKHFNQEQTFGVLMKSRLFFHFKMQITTKIMRARKRTPADWMIIDPSDHLFHIFIINQWSIDLWWKYGKDGQMEYRVKMLEKYKMCHLLQQLLLLILLSLKWLCNRTRLCYGPKLKL